MSINSLPSALQATIQNGFLERAFQESLRNKLGFRAIADREPFPNKIGETLTKTRPSLLAPVTTPLTPAASSDRTSGLTPQVGTLEQYILSVAMYGASTETNLVTEGVAIESKFLKDAQNLGFQAQTSIDLIARNALFDGYMGGNTFVTATIGSPGPTVVVDDTRGFKAGDVVAVGSNTYTVASIAPSGTSSVFRGVKGAITFTGNVTVNDGTAYNAVVNGTAPLIVRPSGRNSAHALTAGDVITTDMLLNAVATMRNNNVPDVDGAYNLYIDSQQAKNFFDDSKFLIAFTGRKDSTEIQSGEVSHLMGVRMIYTTVNPVDGAGASAVRRAMLTGQGALVEGVYTSNGYANEAQVRDPDLIHIVDDVAHIIAEPVDYLKQWIAQSWVFIGGFVAPTDAGTNNSVLPTATASSLKRAIILESL